MASTQTAIVEELITKAQETEEENRDKWRKQLEKDIPDLDKQAQEIQDVINND